MRIKFPYIDKQVNTCFHECMGVKTRYLIMFGGAGSGKSVAASQKIVLRMLLEKGHTFLVVRKVAKTVRNSVLAEIKSIINDWGLQKAFHVPKGQSAMEISCVNGNRIIFCGLDDVEKLKSISGITGIWIEEASEIAQADFKQLDLRLRGKTNHYKQIVLTYNPISALSWLKAYFHDTKNDNCHISRTTYLDNCFIDDEYKSVMEDMKEKDYVFYQIYALGEWGILGNLVYTNFIIEDIPTDPGLYTLYQGLDFGFNDPSAYVKVGHKDNELYILDEFYQKGLTNNELINHVKEVAECNLPIIADSAEPDRIKEFKQQGVNVRAADKGQGSVKAGLDWIRRKKVHIHPKCTNFINEIQAYKYREDKEGNVYEEPVDMNNHLMDALRYAVEPLRQDRRIQTMSKRELGI